MKQNTRTNVNELAHQRQVTPDSNLSQDKHIHNTHCLDTTVQTTGDHKMNNTVIVLDDITSFESNYSNIMVSPYKELTADALSTDGRSNGRRYSIQKNNVMHQPPTDIKQPVTTRITQSPANIRQPIPTRITQRTQLKKSYGTPFWKTNSRNNSNRRNSVATSRTKQQRGEDFRFQTRWRHRMKFYQYFY